ncbi:MAG: diaminopimelate epimerase [Terriglobales bacterium]
MSRSHNNSIAFTKASACGNDFLIASGNGITDLRGLSRRMCDRHNGVGADGVEWTFPNADADADANVQASALADVRVRLFNADGSEAEISGNGTRCVAAEICERTAKREVAVHTAAGVKTCHLIAIHGATFEFESEMGHANVGGQLTIEALGLRTAGTVVSIGNPHYVIFVDRFPEGWQNQAALIQAQPQFPQGTNVEYVIVCGPNEIEIRLFERGVGETLSSGTGSCASAAAAIAAARVASPVRVVAPGGAQTVRWGGETTPNQVYLRGPATLVCRGELFYE